MPEKNRGNIDAQLKRIAELLAERKGDDYESLLKRLTEARELFHDMLAARFTDRFNEHLSSLPQETSGEKSAIAKTANADLRAVGLTIRHPKTHGPAFLACASARPSGSFQICETADARYGSRMTSKLLPTITLMPRHAHGGPNALEASGWTDRIEGSRGVEKERGS